MSSQFGSTLKITIFGESHGRAIGGVADSFPAGETIDLAAWGAFCPRLRPGQALTTPRSEPDTPEILSGFYDGKTTGTPLAIAIYNKDCHSSDYDNCRDVPRPGHADLAAILRYGEAADRRAGGHFSGRLTAPLVALGGIAKQILSRRGIEIGAHLAAAAGGADQRFDPAALTAEAVLGPGQKAFPVIDDECGKAMQKEIRDLAIAGDSAGGVVECAAVGFPAGVGSPMFDGLENRLAAALFGVPAVKGVEFGAGFAAASARGSANNDPFVVKNGEIRTSTNNCGGILGGISTGMPIVLQVAFKPTPSIALTQESVDRRTLAPAKLQISGRHDPCVAIRAVPVVEAVMALVLLDLLMSEGKFAK